jgi:hypothetical protein
MRPATGSLSAPGAVPESGGASGSVLIT